MEALPRIASHLHSPALAFTPIPPIPMPAITVHDSNKPTTSWASSFLNPQNRIDSLAPVPTPRWRIDGCTRLGTQFYAVPLFFHTLPRSCIHLFIPEHSTIPVCLRRDLELSQAFSRTSGEQVANLGVTRHVLRTLEFWTDRFERGKDKLEEVFNRCPYGSCIVLENLVADVKKIRVKIVETYDLERQLLTHSDLLNIWATEVKSPLPPCIDVSCLQLISQLHDTVSLVHRLDLPGAEPLIFKTQTMAPQFLYHELKVLLTLPPHPHIVPAPLNLVTQRCRFGNSVVIVGFTLRYFSKGSLASIVQDLKTEKGHHILRQKAKWASQITKALIHLVENGGVHTDLRLDNIVLSDTMDVILIDHERKGVWHALAAPEVNYLDYLHELAFSTSIPEIKRTQYHRLIGPFASSVPPPGKRYRNPEQGYNFPFAVLDAHEKESAIVYLLGLNLWCLFESIATAEPYFGKASTVDDETDSLRFPKFGNTPTELRLLIDRCTKGRLGYGEKFPVVRQGRFLVLRRAVECWSERDQVAGAGAGAGAEAEGGSDVNRELERVAREWWLRQIGEMEAYVTYRNRLKSENAFSDGSRELNDRSLFERPSLAEVLEIIEEFQAKLG